MNYQFQRAKCLALKLRDQCSDTILLYKHRHTTRKALFKLDDTMLKDIGLSKQQANKEAFKPFWVGNNFNSKRNGSRRPNFQNLKSKNRIKKRLKKPLKSGGVSF